MKRCFATLICFAAACGVADDAVIDDSAPRDVREPVAEQEVVEPVIELDTRTLAAFDKLPLDNGWPSAGDFDAARTTGVKANEIVQCEAATLRREDGTVHETGPVMLTAVDDTTWTLVADADDSNYTWYLRQPWVAPMGLDKAAPVFLGDAQKLECHRPQIETMRATPEPFGAFVYTSTLTTPAEPIFVEPKRNLTPEETARLEELRQSAWSEANIQEVIEIGPPASSQIYGDALAWAEAEGRPDLAYEIHRRYRPVGYCSRDTRPLRAKKDFAKLCDELSRPRCHLALTTELLGYRVTRRSDMWIGGKPVTYNSQLDQLPDAIDRELFMLGLLVDYPGTPNNENAAIAPRFFALATDGSRESAALDQTLQAWLADENVDAWNRHRFGVALFFMRTYGDRTIEAPEHAQAIATLPGLPAVTVAQLRNIK